MKNLYLYIILSICISSCSKQTLKKAEVDPVAVKIDPQYGHQQSVISFSGYSWNVKKPNVTQGPGPNYWSGRNVWVDENGWLHLIIQKNDITGIWECAEVASTQKFGYGSYQWKIEGPISTLDKNIVLGLFNYSGNNMYDEMDIEIARWGNDAWPNLNYTIYPETGQTTAKHKSYSKFFTMEGIESTHRFIRTSNAVTLKSMKGFHDDDTNMFDSKTFTNDDVPVSKLSMPVYMNLWLFEGRAPSNDKSIEIVIKEFKFSPL